MTQHLSISRLSRVWLAHALALTTCLGATFAGSNAALAGPANQPLRASEPSFELLPLGVYGGGYEANLTSFAIRRPGDSTYRVLLDAGSLAGAARLPPHKGDELGRSRGFGRIEKFFLGLEDVLLTHSHLDHLSGLIIQSPSLFARERPPLRVHGTSIVTETLREHVFNGKLWGDFVAAKKLTLHTAVPANPFSAGGFKVDAFPIDHTVEAFGYRLEAPQGTVFYYLGDTGPTRAYLPRARKDLAAGRLRAIALECSFGSEKEELSLLTGHLTPRLLVEHLRELVIPGTEGSRRPIEPDLPEIAQALKGVKILVQHIKPSDETDVRKQLAVYRRQGIPLEITRQTRPILF